MNPRLEGVVGGRHSAGELRWCGSDHPFLARPPGHSTRHDLGRRDSNRRTPVTRRHPRRTAVTFGEKP